MTRMKRITFLILPLFIVCSLSFGQKQMKFDFPAWSEAKLQMYYFYGSKVDSSIVVLDKAGKADFLFPDKDFRGLVQLAGNGVGLAEFIAGEPVLNIVCPADPQAVLAGVQAITFPGSEENAFFNKNLHLKTRLMERLSWLQAGYRFYGQDAGVISFVQQESNSIQDSLQVLEYELAHSSLYAARFVQWVGFINRMYEARQQREPAKIQAVTQEMENTADIDALYTSGQLWNSVFEIYLSVFNQLDVPEKQAEYANSINRTAARLSGKVQESFFAAAVIQCERYGWKLAEDIIIQHLAWTYENIEIKSERLQRLLGIQKTRKGIRAPELAGLTPPVNQPLLLIFYESGCGHCQEQLTVLKENYPAIRDKGIRIVSISSDESQEVYEYHSKDFPWPDKLCDYKGFEGPNFINYGIIGTPSIYLLDKDGIIQGKYGTIAETGVLN